MKFKDIFLSWFNCVFNGVLVIDVLVFFIVEEKWTSLIPFILIIIPLYIGELVFTVRSFKRLKRGDNKG